MKVVVCGGIGAGKSTVVREAMRRLGWSAPGGFFTHWGGGPRGSEELYCSTWGGEPHLMARRRARKAGPEDVPYELETENLRRIAIPSLGAPQGPVVIDELGVIELGSPEFQEAAEDLFRRPVPLLVVIQERALERWRPMWGPDAAVRFFRVNASTREGLPERIAALFCS